MNTAHASTRVGFAGLGTLGSLIAGRLLAVGHALQIYNRTAAKTTALVTQGAIGWPTPSSLAANCEVLLLCLFDDAAVEDVLFGPDGAASSLRAGQVVVDLSTTHPSLAKRMNRRLRDELNVAWVDAPVSGGPPGAAAGTLSAMAGGETADIERVRPLLSSFATTITHIGPAGSGQLAKICNQIVNFGNAIALAEALNLAARSGLDPRVLPQALGGGFSGSPLMRHLGPGMAEGRLGGHTPMTMKDLALAMDLGRDTGSAMPVTALVESFFRLVVARGHDRDGIGGIARAYSEAPFTALADGAARTMPSD